MAENILIADDNELPPPANSKIILAADDELPPMAGEKKNPSPNGGTPLQPGTKATSLSKSTSQSVSVNPKNNPIPLTKSGSISGVPDFSGIVKDAVAPKVNPSNKALPGIGKSLISEAPDLSNTKLPSDNLIPKPSAVAQAQIDGAKSREELDADKNSLQLADYLEKSGKSLKDFDPVDFKKHINTINGEIEETPFIGKAMAAYKSDLDAYGKAGAIINRNIDVAKADIDSKLGPGTFGKYQKLMQDYQSQFKFKEPLIKKIDGDISTITQQLTDLQQKAKSAKNPVEYGQIKQQYGALYSQAEQLQKQRDEAAGPLAQMEQELKQFSSTPEFQKLNDLYSAQQTLSEKQESLLDKHPDAKQTLQRWEDVQKFTDGVIRQQKLVNPAGAMALTLGGDVLKTITKTAKNLSAIPSIVEKATGTEGLVKHSPLVIFDAVTDAIHDVSAAADNEVNNLTPSNMDLPVSQHYKIVDGNKIFVDKNGNALFARDIDGYKLGDSAEKKAIEKYNANPGAKNIKTQDKKDWGVMLNEAVKFGLDIVGPLKGIGTGLTELGLVGSAAKRYANGTLTLMGYGLNDAYESAKQSAPNLTDQQASQYALGSQAAIGLMFSMLGGAKMKYITGDGENIFAKIRSAISKEKGLKLDANDIKAIDGGLSPYQVGQRKVLALMKESLIQGGEMGVIMPTANALMNGVTNKLVGYKALGTDIDLKESFVNGGAPAMLVGAVTGFSGVNRSSIKNEAWSKITKDDATAKATLNFINQSTEDGLYTQEQADRLKQRISYTVKNLEPFAGTLDESSKKILANLYDHKFQLTEKAMSLTDDAAKKVMESQIKDIDNDIAETIKGNQDNFKSQIAVGIRDGLSSMAETENRGKEISNENSLTKDAEQIKNETGSNATEGQELNNSSGVSESNGDGKGVQQGSGIGQVSGQEVPTEKVEEGIKQVPPPPNGEANYGNVFQPAKSRTKTLNEKQQDLVNELPKKKVNYKDIKGIGDLSIYLNNPDALNSPLLKSAKNIYEDIKNGKPIKNTPSVNENMELMDGQNRIAAQLAAGITDIDVAVIDKSFYENQNKPTTEVNQPVQQITDNTEQQGVKEAVQPSADGTGQGNAEGKPTDVETPVSKMETTENPALKDVESTAKALDGSSLKGIVFADKNGVEKIVVQDNKGGGFLIKNNDGKPQNPTMGNHKDISEAYHKAKADGSNPELVKAVEEALTPQTENTKTNEEQSTNADITGKTTDAEPVITTDETSQKSEETKSTEESGEGQREKGEDVGGTGEEKGDVLSGIKKSTIPQEVIDNTTFEKRTQESVLASAKEKVKSGELNAPTIIKGIMDGVENITPDKIGALVLHKADLDKRSSVLAKQLSEAVASGDETAIAKVKAEIQDNNQQLNDFYEAALRSGNDQSLAFSMRKMLLDSEYNLASQVNKYKSASKDGTIPKEVEEKFAEMDRQLKEVNEKLKLAEEKLAEKDDNAAFDIIAEDIQKKSSKKKTRKGRELISEGIDDIADALGVRLSAVGTNRAKVISGLAKIGKGFIEEGLATAKNVVEKVREYVKDKFGDKVNFDEYKDDIEKALNEDIKMPSMSNGKLSIPNKLIRNLVESGAKDINDLTTQVMDMIKDEFPDVTEREVRDAITKYGKTISMSKDEVSTKLREMKRIGKLLSQLEDVSKGKRPLRSGLQRDKATDEERRMQRELQEAMKDLPMDDAEIEKVWKTALDAVKSRLKNQIADLQNQLDTGEKSPRKKGVEYDAEATALKEQRDALKKQLEDIEGKTGISDEQKVKMAIAAAEKSAQEYERRINEKDFSDKPKGTGTPVTPELQAAREKRNALRDTYKQMYAESEQAEQKKLAMAKKAVIKRTAELQRRIDEGDFSTKKRQPVTADAEMEQLMIKRNKIQEEFDKEQEKNRLANRTFGEKVSDTISDVWNLPKGLISTIDMSAPLRQGIILTAGNPKEGMKAFAEMFRQSFSEKKANEWLDKLKVSPEYKLMQDSKLYIAQPNAKLSAKEEAFMTNLAQKIPVYGALVRGSERAYAGFLNKLRVDVFAKGVDELQKQGIEYKDNPDTYKALGDFINNATGRGNLGSLERSAQMLNNLFFSPRMLKSRVNLLNPIEYAKMPAPIRKMAMKNMISFIGFGVAILAMANAAGADTEEDPRSADFGKIKVGNTRYDIWAGFLPIIRTITQMVMGERKSTNSGKIKELDGKGFSGETRADPLLKFTRTKLSPAAGTAADLLTGKDPVGNEVTIQGEVIKNVVPLYLQDIYGIMSDESASNDVGKIASRAVPAFFGVGVQNYDDKKKR